MTQVIHCDVDKCKYQGGKNDCTLHDIQVSNTETFVKGKDDTGCMSFVNSGE